MHNTNLNSDTATIINSEQSEFGCVTVYENDNYRWLSFDNKQAHSAMSIQKPWQVVLPYYPVLLSSLLFNPSPDSVLMIGLGGGDLVRFYHHYLPQSQLKVVEISETVINTFHDYFQSSDILMDNVIIQQGDVCEYINQAKSPVFDTIYMDVYGEYSLPDCFYDRQFYIELAKSISDHGVVAVNFVVKDEADAFRLMRLMSEGFGQQILCLSVGEYMNLVVLGFKHNPLSLSVKGGGDMLRSLSERFELDYSELLGNLIQNNPHLAEQIRKQFTQ
ncbi:MAG: hypothetical protein OEX12_12070 [Gammaproteobacteria bacterium]|nr:hypothetical protein [Gammaproteobacteria bacterium]